ncbi:MAG: glycosyltransferase family 4 protein [Thermodesulfobacteriota bacterium]
MKIACITKSDIVLEAERYLSENYQGYDWTVVTYDECLTKPMSLIKVMFGFNCLLLVMVNDIERDKFQDVIKSILFFSCAKEKIIRDVRGRSLNITAGVGLQAIGRGAVDVGAFPFALLHFNRRLKRLSHASRKRRQLRGKGEYVRALYVRSDPWIELTAGGSVSHTEGVIKGLKSLGIETTYMAPAPMKPLEELGIPIALVKPDIAFLRNIPELPNLVYNDKLIRSGERLFRQMRFGLIYQRYGLLNFTGLSVARRFSVPFVLEYNGSEIWVKRNWGHRLVFKKTAERAELLNLKAADLVVVVSKILKDELMERGIREERVLVNPNGVDQDRFRPDLDGREIRERHDLKGKVVVGFLGTFGRWHGAEVLAKAVKDVVAKNTKVHFLMIGDGVMMPELRETIKRDGVEEHVTLTGLIPQLEAPRHLAACDIFASPHIPNPDGTPFFGSPTKLFEYMAMGRGIVASDLDQIGEILDHGKTAWMVKPGDAGELSEGILKLAGDGKLRERLGAKARKAVLENYTWDIHTKRIMDRLRELLD